MHSERPTRRSDTEVMGFPPNAELVGNTHISLVAALNTLMWEQFSSEATGERRAGDLGYFFPFAVGSAVVRLAPVPVVQPQDLRRRKQTPPGVQLKFFFANSLNWARSHDNPASFSRVE
jgi:hypothetical protein